MKFRLYLQEVMLGRLNAEELQTLRARVEIGRCMVKESFKQFLGGGSVFFVALGRRMFGPEVFGDLSGHLLPFVIVPLVVAQVPGGKKVEFVRLGDFSSSSGTGGRTDDSALTPSLQFGTSETLHDRLAGNFLDHRLKLFGLNQVRFRIVEMTAVVATLEERLEKLRKLFLLGRCKAFVISLRKTAGRSAAPVLSSPTALL